MLKHPRIYALLKDGFFSHDFDTIESFIDGVCESSLYLPTEDLANKAKGDALEILVEFIFMANLYPGRNVINYTPVTVYDGSGDGSGLYDPSDMGVDGWAHGGSGEKLAVQIKFRGNPMDVLTFRDLATFGAHAFNPGNDLSTSSQNLIVVTTGQGVYHTVRREFRGIRVINRKDLARIMDGQVELWKAFKRAVDGSGKAEPRNRHEFMAHQLAMFGHVKNAVESGHKRMRIISATGSGKSLVEIRLVEDSAFMVDALGNKGVFVIAAPRLSLVKQLILELHAQRDANLRMAILKVGSGPDLELEAYSDDELGSDSCIVTTTSTDKIVDFISRAHSSDSHVVIVTTYNSAERVGKALIYLELKADLLCCDEAHNTVASTDDPEGTLFSQVLRDSSFPASLRLFFTATQRTTASDEGHGMNNVSLYGPVVSKIQLFELCQRGLTALPRIHFVNRRRSWNDVTLTDEQRNQECLDIIVEAFKYRLNHVSGDDRLIVSCQSVNQAHELSKKLDLIFPEAYVASISSDRTVIGQFERNVDKFVVFNGFKLSKKSILLHFDMVSEGVDLPGATCFVPLRSMEIIKLTQSIGRVVRVLPEDRVGVLNGSLKTWPESEWSNGWIKPTGDVVIPVLGHNLDDVELVRTLVEMLRNEGFNPSQIIESSPLGRDGKQISDDLFDALSVENPIRLAEMITESYDHSLEPCPVNVTFIENGIQVSKASSDVALGIIVGEEYPNGLSSVDRHYVEEMVEFLRSR